MVTTEIFRNICDNNVFILEFQKHLVSLISCVLGKYLFSLTSKISGREATINSSVICGFWLKNSKQFVSLARKTLSGDMLIFSQLLEFSESSKVVFACEGQKDQLKIEENSYLTITFLDYAKVDVVKEVRKKWKNDKRSILTGKFLWKTIFVKAILFILLVFALFKMATPREFFWQHFRENRVFIEVLIFLS